MLTFSKLHNQSWLVYNNDNHIGEIYKPDYPQNEIDAKLWRVLINGNESVVQYVNLIDAKRAAEHIVMREFELNLFEPGC